MEVNLIAAIDNKKRIAVNGKIPWHIHEDLRRFKDITMGHAVIMGRKTAESIGKPLPGRLNIVVSSRIQNDCFTVGTLDNALVQAALDIKQCSKAFIIGGARLYQEALPLVQRVYLTRVTYDEPGEDEVFFPWNDMWEWNWELKECQLRKGYRFEVWEKVT
jgi:dihydrofolate reductase